MSWWSAVRDGSWVERVSARFELDKEGGGRFGGFEAGLLMVGALGLTLMQFGGGEPMYLQLFGEMLAEGAGPSPYGGTESLVGAASRHPYYELFGLIYWVGFCVLGYVLLPMLYLKLCGRKLGDYYLGFRGFASHAHIYLFLVAPVLLVVIGVSFLEDFQNIYPFYRRSSRSYMDLITWELAYGMQFFALEFFFRGFLLEGLRKWAGYGAVFIMLVPYCMLHFQKTGAESVGSIIAGVVLGTLAMRYRSIWGGVMVHWLVAIEMDVASLIQKGQMPSQWWP